MRKLFLAYTHDLSNLFPKGLVLLFVLAVPEFDYVPMLKKDTRYKRHVLVL